MARPSNTEERRQQIVEGLLRVMAKRGYERASIAEIAKEAGLSSGLVHYHFKDKQEILLTAVEQLAARVRTRGRHAAAARQGARRRWTPSWRPSCPRERTRTRARWRPG
jgi:TetR/AcrR family transcriptional repressor of bet genes